MEKPICTTNRSVNLLGETNIEIAGFQLYENLLKRTDNEPIDNTQLEDYCRMQATEDNFEKYLHYL